MNEMLPHILAELNLQPGQCQRVQVNGCYLEIRRPVEEEADLADMAMLEPWVEFPRPEPIATMRAQPGNLSLPDAPIIPLDDEGGSA